MKHPFVIFWAVLLAASIVWYAFLVVFLGVRGGRELRAMLRELSKKLPKP